MEPALSFLAVAQVAEPAPGFNIPHGQRLKADALRAKTIGEPNDVLDQGIGLLLSRAGQRLSPLPLLL